MISTNVIKVIHNDCQCISVCGEDGIYLYIKYMHTARKRIMGLFGAVGQENEAYCSWCFFDVIIDMSANMALYSNVKIQKYTIERIPSRTPYTYSIHTCYNSLCNNEPINVSRRLWTQTYIHHPNEVELTDTTTRSSVFNVHAAYATAAAGHPLSPSLWLCLCVFLCIRCIQSTSIAAYCC